MKESDILYEAGRFWVSKAVKGKGASFNGYYVWRSGITHSTCCARIGFTGDLGLGKAKAEADRRANKEA